MSHQPSDYLNSDNSESRKELISEGILNLKGSIKGLKIEPEKVEKPAPEPAAPKFDKTELANRSIEMYKKQSIDAPVSEKEVLAPAPSTIASRESLKARARQLAGMRNGGDEGQAVIKKGGANIGTQSSTMYAADVVGMTLEEYQAHIFGSFGITEEEEVVEEVIEEEIDENVVDVISILEEALLEMDNDDWMSVDKVVRAVCEECDILPKELNREFKSIHGLYPDKWIKGQIESEECGYYPLDEAVRMMKVGNLYDVSFVFRGRNERFQFFWPEVARPTFDDMQDAVRKFYPQARLLSFYLAADQQTNGMVIIPPMTESYHIVEESEWTLMSEFDQETFDIICEEEGEPLCSPIIQEDGSYTVFVSDHDTGEEKEIVFGEGLGALLGRKEDPVKKREKMKREAERLIKQVNHPHSDVGVKATRYKVKKKEKAVKEEVEAIEEDMKGMSQKSGDKRSTESGAGMTAKGVAKYNRRTGGDLKTAVTTPPSELKPGSKAAGRRKSFCARSKGWDGERGKAARRRWNC